MVTRIKLITNEEKQRTANIGIANAKQEESQGEENPVLQSLKKIAETS